MMVMIMVIMIMMEIRWRGRGRGRGIVCEAMRTSAGSGGLSAVEDGGEMGIRESDLK